MRSYFSETENANKSNINIGPECLLQEKKCMPYFILAAWKMFLFVESGP